MSSLPLTAEEEEPTGAAELRLKLIRVQYLCPHVGQSNGSGTIRNWLQRLLQR